VSLRSGRGQCLQTLLDFRERLTQLLLPHVVRGHFELPLGFRLGQPQGLYLPEAFGIDLRSAKPGLTGYAQVNGFRGEISDMRCMSDRVAADNSYIEEWSLALDVAILLKTVPLIFRDPNAY